MYFGEKNESRIGEVIVMNFDDKWHKRVSVLFPSLSHRLDSHGIYSSSQCIFEKETYRHVEKNSVRYSSSERLIFQNSKM
ncbi:hypothetical protein V1477_015193 [Vespula maculifrons]|uniref:Uncharacterized protein n=1 Tax=Vespula maculifrons TaxID=7453 RepID=A0ABD2BJK2_VESMC